MAQINFRLDDKTKERAEELFSSLGMTMSGAITVFITQALNYQGLPFIIRKPNLSARPMEELQRRIDDFRQGRNYHFHELIEVDDKTEEAKPRSKRAVSNRRRRASR